MIRDDIKAAQIAAMKAGDKETRNAVSLIQAAIKNRDIEARTGKAPDDDDALVVEVLQKMVKQRRESIEMYAKGGRQELADAESGRGRGDRTLPARADERGADHARRSRRSRPSWARRGMKDMGRVMAELKARHASELDMSKASGLVKAALELDRDERHLSSVRSREGPRGRARAFGYDRPTTGCATRSRNAMQTQWRSGHTCCAAADGASTLARLTISNAADRPAPGRARICVSRSRELACRARWQRRISDAGYEALRGERGSSGLVAREEGAR